MRKLAGIGIALAIVLVASGIRNRYTPGPVQGRRGHCRYTGRGHQELYRNRSGRNLGGDAAGRGRWSNRPGSGGRDCTSVRRWRRPGRCVAVRVRGPTGPRRRCGKPWRRERSRRSTADAIVQIVDGRFERGLEALNGARVSVLEDAETPTFSEAGPGDVAETLRQAWEAGSITQGQANEIVLSLEGDGPANVWRYDGGADGVADAVRQAVEDGVISEALADWILRSSDG